MDATSSFQGFGQENDGDTRTFSTENLETRMARSSRTGMDENSRRDAAGAANRRTLKHHFDKKHSNYSAARRREEEKKAGAMDIHQFIEQALASDTGYPQIIHYTNLDALANQQRMIEPVKIEPIVGEEELKKIQSTFLPSTILQPQTEQGKKNKIVKKRASRKGRLTPDDASVTSSSSFPYSPMERDEIIHRNVLDMIAESPEKHRDEESEGGDSTMTMSDSHPPANFPPSKPIEKPPTEQDAEPKAPRDKIKTYKQRRNPHTRIASPSQSSSNPPARTATDPPADPPTDAADPPAAQTQSKSSNVTFGPKILKKVSHITSFTYQFGSARAFTDTQDKDEDCMDSVMEPAMPAFIPHFQAAAKSNLDDESFAKSSLVSTPEKQEAKQQKAKQRSPVDAFIEEWIATHRLPDSDFNTKDASAFLSSRTCCVSD